MAEPEPNPSSLSVQNADTAKQLTVTQQSQEEVARVKEQLAFQVEQVKRESEMKVRLGAPAPTMPRAYGVAQSQTRLTQLSSSSSSLLLSG